jgi:DNA polymerase III alpha subunit
MIEFTGEKYVNLHNHSYYSALDGLSSPDDMVDACIANGSRALAITDHGTCGGWYNFQKACLAKGVKPILGNEFYISPDHTSVDPKDPRYHLVLLAKNHLGVQNIMELSTIAETKGKYKKPRIDFKLLQAHHEGLICMSACCIGELPSKLWQGDNDGAVKMANEYKDLFGDDYYIEIMMHKYNQNAEEQEKREKVLAKQLYSLAKKLNIKTVCSNDAHYANRSDAPYHDVMLSMQTHDHIKNPDRFTFNGEQFYLRPYEEMYDLYKSAPEMLLHTVEIAEKIESDAILLPSKDLLPIFNVPQGVTSETAYLKELVKEGMKLHGFINDPIYRERIKMEMELIVRCGFVRYFLTLWDIINYAKQQSVRTGIGRGSGAGSLCLYCLGITKLDPIKYGLLFERFINPERVSPPDVDIDFDYSRRDEIFDYIIRKYGTDYCCKIGTYNTFKAKGAIRYAAKALDIGNDWETYQAAKKRNPNAKIEMTKKSLDLADFIAKQIPEVPGTTIESALKDDESFRSAMQKYPKLLDAVRHVENTVSSAGVHPAGIIICKDPIAKHIPLRESKGAICSQFVMSEVDELGLLKLDMLALKTLTVIEDTVQMIKKRYGIDIDIDNLDPTDKNVFKLFNGGYKNMDNRGIFQFEAHGISKLLKSIRVDTFNDLVVCNALYRPGPLGAGVHELYSDYKHGRKKIEYLHPKMGEVLKDTYGIMCFSKDQIVYTNNGPKCIEEICKQPVYCLDNGKLNKYPSVNGAFKSGVREIFEYTLSNGAIIKSTNDHPIFNGENYIAMDEIFYKKLPIHYTLGNIKDSTENEKMEKKAYLWGTLIGGEKNDHKFLPFQNIKQNRRIYLSLLAGLVDTDGSIQKDIYYSSSSNQLLIDVEYVLWRLGYTTYRSHHMVHVYESIDLFNELQPYLINKKGVNRLYCNGSNIRLNSKMVAELLKNKIGNMSVRKFCDINKLNRCTVMRIMSQKNTWCKKGGVERVLNKDEINACKCIFVERRKSLGMQDVYDLSMPHDDHNFIVNSGVSVHNCFQENIMKVVQVLAGFTLGQADWLRKVIGKKKPELIKKENLDTLFIEGCKKHSDIDPKVAKAIFDQIEYFGGYGFNLSHAASYSLISYQTAWLKVYYPLEYMCNLLSSEINNSDKGFKLNSYLSEARRMNLVIKGADINKSGLKYSIASFRDEISGEEKDGIRTPLTILNGVGEKAVESIVANQPFANLKEFLHSVDTRKVTSRVFTALVENGCMRDSWGIGDEALLNQYVDVKAEVDKEKKQKKKKEEQMDQYGGVSIFSAFGSEGLEI